MKLEKWQSDVNQQQDQNSTIQGASGSDLSISDIFRTLNRHKWFIVACTIICIVIAGIYVSTATPIYEATASMRIDPSRSSSLGLNDLLSGAASGDSDVAMKTEILILQSDAVAFDTLNSLSAEEFKRFSGVDKKSNAIPQGATVLSATQENLLHLYKVSLNAKVIEGTQIVAVSFRSPHPDVAAFMVNHAMAAYLRQTFDSRYGSVNQVATWLSTEMDQLKDRAATAQQKLASFQEQNNILGADAANNTTIDRLRLLNTRLAEAQSDRIVKEAQMRTAMAGNPSVLAAMFPNPELTTLEATQGTLYSQYAEMSTKFGAKYPPLADLKQQMQKVDAEVDRQVGSVRSHLKQDYEASLAIERSLQQQVDDQTQKAYALNRQQASYAVLQAEGSSSRDLYDTLQYKLQQAGVDAGLNSVNTMLIDGARAPRIPVEPKKSLILAFGLMLGLFAGLISAFVRETLTNNVQDADQIERVLGYHTLTLIPHLSVAVGKADNKVRDRGGSPFLIAYQDPLSRGAESFRLLRNSVLLSSLDHTHKTLLVTSTLPGEGKSNTTANLAVVLAQKGARVLAIDADLRRPTLHTYFGIPNGIGLSSLILGEDVASPYTQPCLDLKNLTVLPAGKNVLLPSEALSSVKFHSLVEKWKSEYDFIIIDSAPLLIVSDTLPIASWADTLILVTRYNSTPIRGLKRVRDILSRANANVAGVVINDVSEKDAKYGGYDYGYGEYYK